jgi:hypothetical protein
MDDELKELFKMDKYSEIRRSPPRKNNQIIKSIKDTSIAKHVEIESSKLISDLLHELKVLIPKLNRKEGTQKETLAACVQEDLFCMLQHARDVNLKIK